jgi:hypothetical protein
MDIRGLFQTKKSTPVKPIREVTIGLDFGTSTSKLMINFHEPGNPKKDEVYAFAFRSTNKDSFEFLFPSSVATNNGKLLTGFDSNNIESRYESFKMWLPKLAGVTFDEQVTNKYPGLESKIFWLENQPVSAKELAIFHLTDVFYRVRDALSKFNQEFQYAINVNVACPLGPVLLDGGGSNHDEIRKEKYIELVHEIAWRALDLSKDLNLPTTIDHAVIKISEHYEKVPSIKQGETRVSVKAEAHAAVISYIMQPNRKKGRYFTVDIGAGTTDSAMFWLSPVDNRIASYYAFETGYFGMDDFDSALAEHYSVGETMKLREYRENRGIFETDRDFLEPILEKVWSTYKQVFKNAFKLESSANRWATNGAANFDLLLCGGGSEISLIQEEFERSDRTPFPGVVSNWKTTQLLAAASRKVLLENGTLIDNDPIYTEKYDQIRSLLVVAEGLSYHPVQPPPWDIQDVPVQIEQKPISPRTTSEDLYSD